MSSELAPALVLFSGGRDSSLAACLEANRGRPLCLFTAATGATIDTDIVPYRVEEIRRAFPAVEIEWLRRRCSGIFRRIALVDIENDFAQYRTNLILLGNQLAMQADALCVCVERGYRQMVSGFSGYQAQAYMEQTPEATRIFCDFAAEFGVELLTPVAAYASEDDVKYQLLDFGVTTKSLEAVSLFADTFSPAATEDIVAYLESKLQVARRYVQLRGTKTLTDATS